ncbi:CHAT domain-containing protein [Oscillochloris sp. ZM17-4]|nr:CHAT domain-containing protein [Oscillochloris sp. ZM17-4]MBX0326920.1 CHAT domain-containing protein [Oscillochloris sp. ZM17-4]
MRAEFIRARARAQSIPLRLRLALDPADAALHALRWEWLQDPDDGAPLALSQRVLLSRYLPGGSGEPITLPDGCDLRALVLIASPADLPTFRLAPLDVAAEQRRIVAALGTIRPTLLASGTPAAPTLANLLGHLGDSYELLIIVAHGSQQGDTPYLWLERADGSAD